MIKNKEHTLTIPKLGKTISKIQNPINLMALHDSAYQMFTRPEHTKKMIQRLKHEKTINSPYDEKTMDAHDGKVIGNYVKGVKKYISKPNPLHLTPKKYSLDVFTRFNGEKLIANEHNTEKALAKSTALRNQFINSRIQANEYSIDNPPTLAEQAQKALLDNKELNRKYGYKFEDKPHKLGKKLQETISNRNGLIMEHQAEVAEQKEAYFNKQHPEEMNKEHNDYLGATNGDYVKPTKWFTSMDEAKSYAKGMNSTYDSLYKTEIEYNHQHPNTDYVNTPEQLRTERNNKRKFNKSMQNTYKLTKKMTKKLDQKYNHPTKSYQTKIAKYNQIINKELVKRGYLKPSQKGQDMLKKIVGLKHKVHNKKYRTNGRKQTISRKHKRNRKRKLTKQQETKYEKNQGRQI